MSKEIKGFFVLSVFLFLLVFSSNFVFAKSATRVFSNDYNLGDPVSVTIGLSFDETDCGGAVAETLPAGWSATNIEGEGSGIYLTTDNTIRWAPVDSIECGGTSNSYILKYDAIPNSAQTGASTFSGVFSVDGRSIPIVTASSLGENFGSNQNNNENIGNAQSIDYLLIAALIILVLVVVIVVLLISTIRKKSSY